MRVKDKQTETERNLGNTQKIQNKFYKISFEIEVVFHVVNYLKGKYMRMEIIKH